MAIESQRDGGVEFDVLVRAEALHIHMRAKRHAAARRRSRLVRRAAKLSQDCPMCNACRPCST
jgi:hypothetical protein